LKWTDEGWDATADERAVPFEKWRHDATTATITEEVRARSQPTLSVQQESSGPPAKAKKKPQMGLLFKDKT
jgi:hypothetical protein